jgi:hypothetical protein
MFRIAQERDIDRIAEIYGHIHDSEEAGQAVVGWKRTIYPTRGTAEEAVARGEMYVEEDGGTVVAAGRLNQRQEAYRSQLPTVRGNGSTSRMLLDAREVHDAALEAEAEARVARGAVFAQVEIELVVLLLHAQLVHAGDELVVVVLALAAADDLADAGHQAVHRGDGLAVGVELHVEGLDLLGVIRDEDGALEDLLREIALVLGLQVAAPEHG